MLLRFFLCTSLVALLTRSYVTDGEFCNGLPEGSYCSPFASRQIIRCPAAVTSFCVGNQQCQEGPLSASNYTATCQPDTTSDAYLKCKNSPADIVASDCLNDKTVVECPSAMEFPCAKHLVCEKRGLRAYCIQKSTIGTSIDACLGFQGRNTTQETCDPVNLRKVVSCPSGDSYTCPSGQICSALSDSTVGCVNFSKDPSRFCSNKPMYTSYCIPNESPSARFIFCGQIPSVFRCPSLEPKCYQKLSITATCAGK